MLTRTRRNLKRRADPVSLLNVSSQIEDTYQPVSYKAASFHAAIEKVRLLLGANRSSKTYSGTYEGAKIAKSIPNGSGVALTNTYQRIGKYLWPKYQIHLQGEPLDIAWANKRLRIPHMVRLIRNGFTIYFGTYEQGRETHQGDANDFIHLDEEAPEEIYKELFRSTLDRKGKIIYTMTPLKGFTYVYTDIFQKAATSKFIWALSEPMTMEENPYIPKEEVEAFKEILSEEDQQARIYGCFSSPEGAVYKSFNPDIHVIDSFPIPDDWKFYRAIDFGWNHPTVSLLLASDGESLYIIDEYYQAQRLQEYHAEQMKQQIAEIQLLSGSAVRPYVHTVSDHDRQEVKEYAALGIYTDSATKDVIPGIELVRSLLKVKSNGRPNLYVFRTCEHTISEFRIYAYPGKDRKGKLKEGEKADHPMKEHDHCMDCVRYGAVEAFGFLDTDYNIQTA